MAYKGHISTNGNNQSLKDIAIKAPITVATIRRIIVQLSSFNPKIVSILLLTARVKILTIVAKVTQPK